VTAPLHDMLTMTSKESVVLGFMYSMKEPNVLVQSVDEDVCAWKSLYECTAVSSVLLYAKSVVPAEL